MVRLDGALRNLFNITVAALVPSGLGWLVARRLRTLY